MFVPLSTIVFRSETTGKIFPSGRKIGKSLRFCEFCKTLVPSAPYFSAPMASTLFIFTEQVENIPTKLLKVKAICYN